MSHIWMRHDRSPTSLRKRGAKDSPWRIRICEEDKIWEILSSPSLYDTFIYVRGATSLWRIHICEGGEREGGERFSPITKLTLIITKLTLKDSLKVPSSLSGGRKILSNYEAHSREWGECVLSHIWIRPYINASWPCDLTECVLSHIWIRPYMNASWPCDMTECVLSHIWIRPYMNKSWPCDMTECVLSHIWIRSYIKGSWLTLESEHSTFRWMRHDRTREEDDRFSQTTKLAISFMCATLRIHIWVMTHSYMWHDTF